MPLAGLYHHLKSLLNQLKLMLHYFYFDFLLCADMPVATNTAQRYRNFVFLFKKQDNWVKVLHIYATFLLQVERCRQEKEQSILQFQAQRKGQEEASGHSPKTTSPTGQWPVSSQDVSLALIGQVIYITWLWLVRSFITSTHKYVLNLIFTRSALSCTCIREQFQFWSWRNHFSLHSSVLL